MATEISLWDRSRAAAHVEITGIAMGLFLQQGFDQTTIDQIAAAAGISRRSFFRYFGTKEDLVLGDLAQQGEFARDALEAIPLNVGPWDALRDAFATVDSSSADRTATLKISQMMYGTPSLRARRAEKHLHWQSLLVPNIRVRLGGRADDDTDPTADAIVASAIACLYVSVEIWTRGGGTADLGQLFERAVAGVTSPRTCST